MKTLVLLSALVLLALHVQAGPIREAEEEAKTEEQPADEDQGVYPLGSARRFCFLKFKLKKILGMLLQNIMQKFGMRRWEVRARC
ncbi:defensin alpha-like protein 1 [Rattus rattus]|uniref:defensin alpha-like protein 1 n=1 Tax=Rattus rattus TaxID=10117 RepID=UPI0013F35133|nr:defensin alpha-like protein 1 [Rattus rattus]